MRRIRLAGVVPALAAMAMLLAACGGGGVPSALSGVRQTTTSNGAGQPKRAERPVLDIYSSLPLQGPSRMAGRAIRRGIMLALARAHDRAGEFRVRYRSLDDASARTHGWSAARVTANARLAATDPDAIYYIGEFDSAATELSMPILNLAEIPQVSPASTDVGLTLTIKGVTAPGELGRLQPDRPRTFLRLVPSDIVQAAADLLALHQAGCTDLAIAHQDDTYGDQLTALMVAEAKEYGIAVVTHSGFQMNLAAARSYVAFAAEIHAAGAGCLALVSAPSRGATALATDVHLASPRAPILGTDKLCRPRWTDAAEGGVPAAVAPSLLCTLPTLPLRAYPQAGLYRSWFERRYGRLPTSSYSLYGYEAAELGLSVIGSLGREGDDRADVIRSLFAIVDRESVIGSYGFTATGDTTLDEYGLYRVGHGGRPVYYRTLIPTKLLPSRPLP